MRFANLANKLDQDLPVATKNFGLESVKFYYNNKLNLNHSRLKFQVIPAISIISLLKTSDINKAYGKDNFFGGFSKDSHNAIARSVT